MRQPPAPPPPPPGARLPAVGARAGCGCAPAQHRRARLPPSAPWPPRTPPSCNPQPSRRRLRAGSRLGRPAAAQAAKGRRRAAASRQRLGPEGQRRQRLAVSGCTSLRQSLTRRSRRRRRARGAQPPRPPRASPRAGGPVSDGETARQRQRRQNAEGERHDTRRGRLSTERYAPARRLCLTAARLLQPAQPRKTCGRSCCA